MQPLLRLRFRTLSVIVVLALAAAACNFGAPNSPQPTAELAATSLPPTAAPIEQATVTGAPTTVPVTGVTPTTQDTAAATSTTAAPTDQPTAKPTKKPNGVTGDTLSDVPPDEVVRELALYVGSGGGEVPSCNFEINEPQLAFGPQDREKIEPIDIVACGWQQDEKVRLTVTYPDGTQKDFGEKKAKNNLQPGDQAFGVAFTFRAGLKDPAGTYTFTLQGDSAKIESPATVSDPAQPRLVVLSAKEYKALTGKSSDTSQILFYNFQPAEKVKLLVFKDLQPDNGAKTYAVQGSQDVKMKDDGTLLLPTDLVGANPKPYWQARPKHVFAALGEASGEVHQVHPDFFGRFADALEDFQLTCAGAPPPVVNFTTEHAVSLVAAPGEGQSLDIRSEPGFASFSVNAVADGVEAAVLAPAKCADSTWWWNVSPPDGSQGWLPQTLDGKEVVKAGGE